MGAKGQRTEIGGANGACLTQHQQHFPSFQQSTLALHDDCGSRRRSNEAAEWRHKVRHNVACVSSGRVQDCLGQGLEKDFGASPCGGFDFKRSLQATPKDLSYCAPSSALLTLRESIYSPRSNCASTSDFSPS